MALIFVSVVGSMALFSIIGGAGAAIGSRLVGKHHLSLLAGFALVAVGLVAMVMFAATWLFPAAAALTAGTILVGGVVTLIAARVWRFWRTIAVGAAGVGSIVAFDLGMLYLRRVSLDPFVQAQRRFLPWPLPQDNELPRLLASWLAHPGPGRFLLGDWLPSDRPPQQAGLILFARLTIAPAHAMGLQVRGEVVDIGASIAAQLLWVPAAAALLVALGYRQRVVIASVLFASTVPTMFLNSVYTWPKLLAAAMCVGSLAVLVGALRGAVPAFVGSSLGAVLAALGVLAHGGSAFVLPAVGLLWVWLIVRSASRTRTVLVSAVVAAAVYLPWAFYQRFAYPPGDRLLKWHLAGVVPIGSQSFLAALVNSYRKLSWNDWLAGRWANLSRAFDLDVFADFDIGRRGAIAARLTREFYSTPPALAVGAFIVATFLIFSVVRSFRTGPRREDFSLILVTSMLACILLWALVMFMPGAAIVHQGSHAWIVVLLCVPFAWLASRSRLLAGIALAVQVVWSISLYSAAPLVVNEPLDSNAILLLVTAALLAVGSLLLARGRTRRHPEPSQGIHATSGRTTA